MAAAGIRVNWDGSGDSYAGIVVSGANRFDFTNEDLTICGWMRIRGDKPGTSTSSEGQVFCWLADTGSTGAHFRVRAIDSDNTFEVSPFEIVARYMDTTFAQADVGTTGDVVDTDESWFFAMTWNHTTQVLTFYYVQDGQTIASTASGSGLALLALMDTIRLGAMDSSSRGGNLEIRNVGVWKRLHNSGEIDAQRVSTSAVISTGLWAYWPLADSSDTSDASGNGRTLTMTGTVTNGAMDPADLAGGGGRYLLEGSGVDGYLLEGGGGVLLLEGAGGATIVEADGSSSGAATVTASSATVKPGVGSAAGVATPTGASATVSAAAGSSAGVATAAAVGAAPTAGVGSSAGVATVSGVSAATAASVGSSAGVATASAVAQAIAGTVATASGTATPAAVSAVIYASAGASAGAATAAALSAIISQATGSASCSAAVAAVSAIVSGTVFSSAGVGTAAATASYVVGGVGSSSGVGSASGVSGALSAAVASAAGAATVSGVGRVSLVGVTRDNAGSALGTCVVHLFRTSDDVELDQVTSNGSGVFAFYPTDPGPFYLVAYKAGSPDVAGTSKNTLTAT